MTTNIAPIVPNQEIPPPIIDDISLLHDAADLDYQLWKRMVKLGVVISTGIGANGEIEVQLDSQQDTIQVPKNTDVTFSVGNRVLLIDTNGNGGFVALFRWPI